MRVGAAHLYVQPLVLRKGSGMARTSSEIPQASVLDICVALGK